MKCVLWTKNHIVNSMPYWMKSLKLNSPTCNLNISMFSHFNECDDFWNSFNTKCRLKYAYALRCPRMWWKRTSVPSPRAGKKKKFCSRHLSQWVCYIGSRYIIRTHTQAVNSLESFRPSVYTICIIDNSPGSTSAGLPESSPGSFSVLPTEKAQRKLYFGSVYLYSYPFIKIIKQTSAPSVNR